jgi:O-acetyl-ADP-ribose deacetylase (regulator of RNase III)
MTESDPVNVPTERFVDAVGLAARLHAGQARKGTTIPYLSHLLGVASLIIEHGGDEDLAIAGLLHDAIEDAGGVDTEVLIREQFGDRVADVVRACSDTDVVPKPPWSARKQAYLAHLQDAPPDVLLVSLADKVHNARSLAVDAAVHGADLWSRFNANAAQSHWYYSALYRTFERRLPGHPLVGELRASIERIWGGLYSPPTVRVVEGDITTLEVDAIVNAANEQLTGGSGVCGAIFSGAGWDEMQRACDALGGCPTGSAKTTPGFDLPARWVIHAVGPIWRGGSHGEEELLRSAYRSALVRADEVGARSIAFPLLSSGIYGYPLEEACRVAVETLSTSPTHVADIVIVTFDAQRSAIVRRLLDE